MVYLGRKLELAVEPGLEHRHTEIGCRCLNQHLYTDAKHPSVHEVFVDPFCHIPDSLNKKSFLFSQGAVESSTTLFLCTCVARARDRAHKPCQLSSISSYEDTNPTLSGSLWSHFTLNTSLKALFPYKVTLGVKTSSSAFGVVVGGTQSIAKAIRYLYFSYYNSAIYIHANALL